jgi:hypothetical protein
MNAGFKDFKYMVTESYGFQIVLVCTLAGYIGFAWSYNF